MSYDAQKYLLGAQRDTAGANYIEIKALLDEAIQKINRKRAQGVELSRLPEIREIQELARQECIAHLAFFEAGMKSTSLSVDDTAGGNWGVRSRSFYGVGPEDGHLWETAAQAYAERVTFSVLSNRPGIINNRIKVCGSSTPVQMAKK